MLLDSSINLILSQTSRVGLTYSGVAGSVENKGVFGEESFKNSTWAVVINMLSSSNIPFFVKGYGVNFWLQSLTSLITLGVHYRGFREHFRVADYFKHFYAFCFLTGIVIWAFLQGGNDQIFGYLGLHEQVHNNDKHRLIYRSFV